MTSSPKIMKQEDIDAVFEALLSPMRYYVDENNDTDVYVEYLTGNGYYEFQSIEDKRFTAYVRMSFRSNTNENYVPSHSNILLKYSDQAIVNNNAIAINRRIAGCNKGTAYYLGDKNNRIVCVTKKGYQIVNRCKQYKFIKTANTLPQVEPKKTEGQSLLDLLSPFLNMDEGMKILFAVNLVQQFICTSSHFVGVISSEKGSGKSTLTKIWHNIIDPTKAEVSIMPKNVEELKNHLANNKVVVFDNTQLLSQEFSDILCGAVTGTAYTKRELYTNSNELVYKLKNTVIINGISVIPHQSDLLDRTLLFRLNSISEEDVKDEETLEKEFKKVRPYILGSIFEMLSEYFKHKDNVIIKGNHRMSRAYKDCYVIATVLGVADEFVKAFEQNQAELEEDCENNNSLISAFNQYFKDSKKTGSLELAAKIYDDLKQYVSDDDTSFPNSPSAFTSQLRKDEELLRKAGIKFCKHANREGTLLMINKI